MARPSLPGFEATPARLDACGGTPFFRSRHGVSVLLAASALLTLIANPTAGVMVPSSRAAR